MELKKNLWKKDFNMRMYLDDLTNPEELYKHISDVRNVQWFYDDGIPVDYETSALADRYTEYAMMCRVGDETPMSYTDWLTLDARYQEHKRTAPNPLTPETFQRMQEVKLPNVIDLQAEVDRLNKQVDVLKTDNQKLVDFHENQKIDFWARIDKLQDQLTDAIKERNVAYSNVQGLTDRVCSLNEEISMLRHNKPKEITYPYGQGEEEISSGYSYEELAAIRQELTAENEDMIAELESLKSAAGQRTTPANQPLYPHYFREVTNVTHVDVYWLLRAWDVSDPCVQHAVKKLIAAGRRGAKDKVKDLKEAKDSIVRALELGQTT
jgi:hypothetical protein